MLTFVSAYSIVLLAVVGYVARMANRQQQLRNAIESLRPPHADAASEHSSTVDPSASRSRAA
jgi:hypothetical protein